MGAKWSDILTYFRLIPILQQNLFVIAAHNHKSVALLIDSKCSQPCPIDKYHPRKAIANLC